MRLTLSCPSGHRVTYTAADRGGELYCGVCGQLCPVPAADAPADRPGVFSAAGADRAAARRLGDTPCPGCRTPVPYTVGEYGTNVTCRRCGAAVPIGERLRAAAAPPPAFVPPPSRRTVRHPVRTAILVGLFAGGVLGGGFVLSRVAAGADVGGLVTWSQPLLDGLGGNPGPAADPPVADPKVTLAMIEELLTQEPAAALATARRWQQDLTAARVPDADPRAVRLRAVVPELEKKLAGQFPPPDPSPAGPFMDAIKRMRNAMNRSDLPAARAAGDDADKLLAAHPDRLQAIHRDLLQDARRRLAELEQLAARPTPADVERLLDKALAAAEPGTVTEAAEWRARARFTAGRAYTPDPAAADRLARRDEQVMHAVRRAQGRRASDDMLLCLTLGDDQALGRLREVAREVLPKYTNDAKCLLAYQAAERWGKMSVRRATGSEFGQRTLFRLEYEAALDTFLTRDPGPGVAAFVRAERLAADADQRSKLTPFVLDGLRAAVESAVGLSDREPDVWDRLVRARAALDAAGPWRDTDDWKALNTAVRDRIARLNR